MELSAVNLAFGYGRQRVGKNLDLQLSGGEILCLLGPNGCGKTTLFKTLLGLLPRQAGHIDLDGRDLNEYSRAGIARRMAYVPQAHEGVFAYSVHEMVLMGRNVHQGLFSGPDKADRLRATAALQDLGIADLAKRDYTRLSGGQRQLVLIARALAQDAPLIVMDEPTASLDFGNQARVLAQIVRLAERGLGIVFSTHNPDHAWRYASQVLLLKDGRALACGAPEEALTERRLSEVYGLPVRVEALADHQRVCVARPASRS